MGFFGEYRATRRDERELGEGVWRRAHDRFKRGLDRYHQILESVRDPELRAAAVPLANELADLLPRVRAVCMEAHGRAPSQTQDIPHSTSGYLSDVHRQLSRAGNAMAQTAEALTMARFTAQGTGHAGPAGAPGTPARNSPTRPVAGADAAGAPEHPESSSAGVGSIRRRSAVVAEYVAAAEELMASHASSRF
ncbi:hypothetical protein [Kocuria tytonis]|uniref:Dehydrogenase n=1 Tax=Kocuria tytonis TaxID=2054280 RepID=A0A495A2W0_9MICC|nr:hypothetical protein [Kocuria tytonis]RKQ33634.1 hypothetical protein C1C97_010410 [Kocuria tytonis]